MALRRIAICVFRLGSKILAAHGYDEVTKEQFFRPLGGGIEEGETPADALRREILEETGLAVAHLKEIGIIDNRFEYMGEVGHEIVHVFDGSFMNPRVTKGTGVPFTEHGRTGAALWLDLHAPLPAPLYPRGLAEMVQRAV